MRALLEHLIWELFDYPPYSPDLAPSGYHLLTYLKDLFGSQRLNSNEEMMEGVRTWLSSQAADIFGTGIQNLFPDTTCASILAVTTQLKFVIQLSFLIAWFVNSSPEVTFRTTVVFCSKFHFYDLKYLNCQTAAVWMARVLFQHRYLRGTMCHSV
jgi:hypothetical protein